MSRIDVLLEKKEFDRLELEVFALSHQAEAGSIMIEAVKNVLKNKRTKSFEIKKYLQNVLNQVEAGNLPSYGHNPLKGE